LPAKHAACLPMPLKQPGFKTGFHDDHARAVACPDLLRVMYLDLPGGFGS